MGAWQRGRPLGSAGSRGQVLVLFALGLMVLLGAAGIAFDAGRFLMERRSLQNAADAAALAAANSLIRGGSTSDAEAEARAVLAINLAHGPNGIVAPLPPSTPVYDYGQPNTLVNGILISGGDIRVAIQNTIPFTFGRAVGLVDSVVGARARVALKGSLMPIAVRRYLGGTGPNSPVPNPCPDPISASNTFFDLAATTATDCQGAVDATSPIGYGGRMPASPSSPGPAIQLVGQGADANSGGVSFRGFINLDVRNFEATTSRAYYSGLTAGTQPNSQKTLESGWVTAGYLGPMFPSVTTPPDPYDQVGILDGTSAGLVVKGIKSRFQVGDVILAALYDGSVKTIPAFLLAQKTAIPTLTAGAPPLATAGAITITNNKAFLDRIGLSIAKKPSWLTIGLLPIEVPANYPQGTTVNLANASALTGTPATIDTAWVKGSDTNQPFQQYAPDFYLPMDVQVGSVAEDFTWSPPTPALAPTNWGADVEFTLTLTARGSADFTGGNTVTVSLDESGAIYPAFPAGSFRFNGGTTSAAVAMTAAVMAGHGANSTTTYQGTTTLTVNTTMLGAQGTYSIPLLMTGTNSSGQVVNHADVLKVLASDASTSTNYIDIIGFAAYSITQIDANTVWGEAVSPVEASPDDPALRRGQVARLVPWD